MGKRPQAPLDPQAIDALYGLEPVYEPVDEPGDAAAGQNASGFVAVQCPYCGEGFETAVDLSAGAFSYVEDCPVCCQPIELSSEMDERGAFVGVHAGRGD